MASSVSISFTRSGSSDEAARREGKTEDRARHHGRSARISRAPAGAKHLDSVRNSRSDPAGTRRERRRAGACDGVYNKWVEGDRIEPGRTAGVVYQYSVYERGTGSGDRAGAVGVRLAPFISSSGPKNG